MRLLRTLLYGLILIVVGLISALTAMRFAIHGREVSVPKLTGLTAAEAQRVAGDSGLAISREQRFYSSDVPEGRIVSQLPQAGTRVRTGFLIRIAESRGPQKVEIPSLVGQSVRSAELNLKERGLELGSVAHLATANAAADQVIAQSPTPDAQQISTPSVSLLTSVAPAPEAFVMPNFVGSKLSEASAAIRVAGLAVGTITTAPPAQPATANSDSAGTSAGTQSGTKTDSAGAPAAAKRLVPTRASSDATITRQTPVAGQRVFPGNTVQFEIASPAR
jgi:beta-lactam-binding protein with PASTA domain